jgi:hypothetical protein
MSACYITSRTQKDLEGGSRGLIGAHPSYLPWGKLRQTSVEDCQCPGQNSNNALFKYKSTTLPLD